MIAGGLISWAAAQHGDRPSLVFRDRVFSHAQIESRSNRMAQALVALGLAPEERFAVLLENSVESIDSVFGAEKAALTYVALNARHTLAEHLEILADAQASAVLVGPAFASMVPSLLAAAGAALPHLRHVIGTGFEADGVVGLESLVIGASEQAPNLQITGRHLGRIAYTSGTTGRPKGVAYTVERQLARLNNHFLAMEYGLSVDDAMLHVGPLTHAAGVYLFPCFLRGARNVVLDRFDPMALLTAIEQHRITHLMLVPTMMARLVDAVEAGARADLSSLRRIHYGTAPTPVALLRRALRAFGPILRQQYGMTEAVQPLAVLYPHEHMGEAAAAEPAVPPMVDARGHGAVGEPTADDRLASCGRPTCNVHITVRGTDGQELPAGSVGEIAIAHQGVAQVAFWRRPELEAEVIRDGWFYAGDLGRFDANGYLYIVGRNKDMIISGGFNVYAREVEEALLSHPDVADAAVLGLPDAQWGEMVAAVVVLRPQGQVDAAALQSHCGERIAGYKKPRRIVMASELPRNAAGKVVKARLSDLFER